MAEEEPERPTGSGCGRGQGLRLVGRRPHTWEISDSDTEGTAARVVGPQAPSTVGELRATTKALRADQVLKNLVVYVDPGEGRGAERLGIWCRPPNRVVSPISPHGRRWNDRAVACWAQLSWKMQAPIS